MVDIELYPSVVEMPKISIGVCNNSYNCKEYATDLAEGWCVKCWDKSLNTRPKTIEAMKRKEEKNLKGLNRIETRGRHIKNCTCEYHTSKGFA